MVIYRKASLQTTRIKEKGGTKADENASFPEDTFYLLFHNSHSFDL